jgi:hypothetical protein
MFGNLHEIIEKFPYELKGKESTPAAWYLFNKNKQSVKLNAADTKIFHHTVAKILWALIRVRPNLLAALSYLTCQVKSLDQED